MTEDDHFHQKDHVLKLFYCYTSSEKIRLVFIEYITIVSY